MSIITSTYQIALDHEAALKEMASNLDQRVLKGGKERHEIGGKPVDACKPIIIPIPQFDTSQVSGPRMRRKTETSPRPALSAPLSSDVDVRKQPSGPLAQLSRPVSSEKKRVEPTSSPLLSREHNSGHPSIAEENISPQITSPAKVSQQSSDQLIQMLEPFTLLKEISSAAAEPKTVLSQQPIEESPVPPVHSSSNFDQTQNSASPRAAAAPMTTTPTLTSDQSQWPPTLSHRGSGAFTENTKTAVDPVQVLSSSERQSGIQPTENGSFKVERKQLNLSPSTEKIRVNPSKDDEWTVPSIDFNILLDLKRPNLMTEERKPASIAPSYDEVLKFDKERTDSSGTRSPTMSSERPSPLPWTPHFERENFPELALVQSSQITRPLPRRIDTIDPDSFPEPLTTLQPRGTGAMSIVSDESEPSRFVQSGSTSKSKKWGGLFKSNRMASTSSVPQSIFSASGKSLILWNELGAGCYDLNNAESIQFRRINARDVRLAAGGAAHLAVITKIGTVSFPTWTASILRIDIMARATNLKYLKGHATPHYEIGGWIVFRVPLLCREMTSI